MLVWCWILAEKEYAQYLVFGCFRVEGGGGGVGEFCSTSRLSG